MTVLFAPMLLPWITLNPFFAKSSRQLSHTELRSAYVELKNGFVESFFAGTRLACTTARDFARLAMLSLLFITFHSFGSFPLFQKSISARNIFFGSASIISSSLVSSSNVSFAALNSFVSSSMVSRSHVYQSAV